MQERREGRLLAAFRSLPENEQDLILELAETRAAKVASVRPRLTLVVLNSGPATCGPLLGRAPG